MKIFDYKYRARRLKDGKVIKGITEAPSKAMAERFLIEQSLKPIEVFQHKSIMQQLNRITLGQIISERDLIFYLKQLASLLNASVKLNEASEILATQQTNKNIRRILYGIYYEVNSGSTLADAYAEYPKDFPKILISMVGVGEKTGDLKGAVRDIVSYFETQYRLQASIKAALMMPLIYIGVAIGVGVFLMLAVMPGFVDMFESNDAAEMPAITLLFINVGDFIQAQIVLIIIGIPALVFLFRLAKKRIEKFRTFLSYLAIKTPIFGDITKLNNLSRIASTLSQMLNNHVPLQDSLATTYDTLGNKIYGDLIVQAQKNVNNGEYMSQAFENHYAVDVVFARMVSVGERTGELGMMLRNLSAFYDEDSNVKIERIRKAIEPILMVFIFGMITVMLLAIMLPSLSFTQQV